MPCRLSPQWICGNSCPWAHDVQLHIAGTKALCMLWITYDHLCYVLCFACWALFGSLGPGLCNVHCVLNCMSGHKTIVAITGRAHCFHDGTLFSWLHVYYVHLASVRFEQPVSWTTYDYIYIYMIITNLPLAQNIKIEKKTKTREWLLVSFTLTPSTIQGSINKQNIK